MTMNWNEISIALRVTLNCMVFAYFVYVSMNSRFRYGNLRSGLIICLHIIITVAVTVLFLVPSGYLADYSTWGIVLWLLCAMTLFRIVFKGSHFEILFIVLVILNLYVNIMAITKVVVDSAALGLSPDVARLVVSMGVLVFYIPLLWVLFVKIYKQVVEFQIKFSFWRYIWIIPALTYMIFYVKIVDDYWKKPSPTGIGDIVFSILWSFTTYAFFLVTLQMLIQAYRGITAVGQAKLMSSQIRMQESQYEKLLDNIESTSRLRHDWRHHLLTINGFADDNNMEELRTYLRELLPGYAAEGEASVCQNYVVDVILRHYEAIAKAHGIGIQIDTDIPKHLKVLDADLCIIFGNLVENAVEACTDREITPGEGVIEIKARMKETQLIAQVKNTYQNKILEDGCGFKSSKHEGQGIGLSSVKKVVEKYEGILKISYDGRWFTVNVLLNVAKAS